jgi:hypothetical protein
MLGMIMSGLNQHLYDHGMNCETLEMAAFSIPMRISTWSSTQRCRLLHDDDFT